MLMTDRIRKLAEIKQLVRDELFKVNGEPLPREALLTLYVFDAAAYVNIMILGRNPDETIKALRGEEPT